MAMSDNLVRNKMLEVERERLEVEKNKVKAITDVRDVLWGISAVMLANLAVNERVSKAMYTQAENMVNDIKDKINERWSE